MTHKIHHSVRSEYDIQGGRRILLDFRWGGETMPALLLMPAGRPVAPAALLLHGLNLDKERMSDMAGHALLRKGIASLTLDLPLHGERSSGSGTATESNPFEMMRRWRGAQEECLVAIRYLASHPGLDATRIGLVGYSLGAFLGLRVAAEATRRQSPCDRRGRRSPGLYPLYFRCQGFFRSVEAGAPVLRASDFHAPRQVRQSRPTQAGRAAVPGRARAQKNCLVGLRPYPPPRSDRDRRRLVGGAIQNNDCAFLFSRRDPPLHFIAARRAGDGACIQAPVISRTLHTTFSAPMPTSLMLRAVI